MNNGKKKKENDPQKRISEAALVLSFRKGLASYVCAGNVHERQQNSLCCATSGCRSRLTLFVSLGESFFFFFCACLAIGILAAHDH